MKVRTLINVLVSTFLFSSMEIALKIAGSSFNPVELNFIRFLLGGLVLLPFAISRLRKKQHRLGWKELSAFALTGFTCVVVSMTLYQLAIQVTEPAIIAILLSANPVFGMLIGLIFMGEKMSRTNTLAVILTIVGLLVIVNPFKLTNPLGITLGLLSAITFGLYGVFTRVSSNKLGLDGLTMTCFSSIVGAGELAILMGLSHIKSISQALSGVKGFSNIPYFAGINLHTLPLILYIGFLVTGVAFGLYFIVMDEAGIPVASLIFFIKPALAPILALIVLAEPIHINTIIGIIIILLGSVITLMGEKLALLMNSNKS